MNQQTYEQAVGRQQAGRLREAEELYRQILARQPDHVGALHNLGMLAHQAGQIQLAVELFGRAVALSPGAAEAQYNLGSALKDLGRLDEAVAAYRRAIALKPNLAQAYNNLGIALTEKGEPAEAIAVFGKAISLCPDWPEAHSNLGNALHAAGRFSDAIDACRRAISMRPEYPEAYCNLGNGLKDSGRLDEAMAAYRRAVALNPNLPQAHSNVGNALLDMGQLDEAISAHRRAIALQPGKAEAHFNLALALLHRDMTQGWQEYEWRLKTHDSPWPWPRFAQPLWDGGELNGRTILLYSEQGFGETIQFIRYAPMVARRGGRVIVEVQPELIRLLSQLPGVESWVSRGQALPAFDVQCPLLSLPRIFGTTLQTVPAQEVPLRPEPELLQIWRARLQPQGAGLNVGLAWAGNPNFKSDRTRSISLDQLAPLANAAGVTFYSIQKGGAARQADEPPAGLRLVNMGPELRDFADTAAVMSLMDLIVTTDTSVAHLAGAMGRPVWVMLQFMPDWRWLSDRADSPWYPSMRLFRQSQPGDWAGVVARVAQALDEIRREPQPAAG